MVQAEDQKTLEYIEEHFGTDEALGVFFRGERGERYSLEESESMFARLGDKCPDMYSVFPDETSAITCTNYAVQVARKLKGRTRIFGFANTDNPASRVAREEIHPGGHDFAVVDDRYLVDPWIRLVACASQQMCFDLQDSKDAALALDIYGSRACWRHMVEAEANV
ncbi:hypothetical protein LMG29542_02248 [Paraburkholderia humisilvae]|uniref:Uncharacterized protein n=2 Tax=Paraburkholderia humisilvae TaxID=627669 RepID=A0A6J5DIU3_9BURK|nr:hypothetical protein LMG29542_02248 [Paraburkholderia humisilvae]